MKRSVWLAPVYPLLYWLMMAAVTVRSTLPALLRSPPRVAQWSTLRAETASAPRPDVTALVPAPRADQSLERPVAR